MAGKSKGKGWIGDLPPVSSTECYKCGKRTILHEGERLCQNQACEKFTTPAQREAQKLLDASKVVGGYVRTVKESDRPKATFGTLVDDG